MRERSKKCVDCAMCWVIQKSVRVTGTGRLLPDGTSLDRGSFEAEKSSETSALCQKAHKLILFRREKSVTCVVPREKEASG